MWCRWCLCDTQGLNPLLSGISSHYTETTALNAPENTRNSRPSSEETGWIEKRQEGVPIRFRGFIFTAYLHHVHPSPPSSSSPAMDPPRTRSRSRSGFYHFGMNGNVGSNGNGNTVGNGSLMNASGGGVSYPQQSNPGWMPHHGGRSYAESQQQHTQGSYLSAGAQRHSSHGAHRHPGAGK